MKGRRQRRRRCMTRLPRTLHHSETMYAQFTLVKKCRFNRSKQASIPHKNDEMKKLKIMKRYHGMR